MLLLLKSGTVCVYAQSLSPEVIGSAGDQATVAKINMAWTIGEVIIETSSSSTHFLTQGFHQPELMVVKNNWTFFIPEGFSPNGDGINDLFIIRGVEHYPKNSISIFNRWGDLVFESTPYKNTWDGRTSQGLKIGGNELPIGTYFYLFNPGDGSPIIKGTIYLNR